MMRVTIENLLAYELATLAFEPGVTVVAGKNATGKSSLAMILGALVANQPNPGGLDAARRKAYIRDGHHEGEASIEDPEGHVLTWRPATSSIVRPDPDIPVWSCPEAAGLVDFMEKRGTGPARAEPWKLLMASDEDPKELLKRAWGERGAGDLMTTLKIIEAKNWDAAEKVFHEKWTEAKALWRVVTGEVYGDKKAVSWVPEHWDATLATASEAELEAELTNARDDKEAITAQAAVSASDVAKAFSAKNRLDALRRELSEKRLALEQRKDLDELRMELTDTHNQLSEVKSKRTVSEVQVEEAKKAKAEIPALEQEIEALGKDIEDCSKRVATAKSAVDQLDDNRRTLDKDHQGSQALLKAEAPLKCPGCGLGLVLVHYDPNPADPGKLEAWEPPTGEDVAEAQAIVDTYQTEAHKIAAARQEWIDDATAAQKEGREKAQERERHRGRLSVLQEQAKLADATPVPEGDVVKERQALEERAEALMLQVDRFQTAAGEIRELEGQIKTLEPEAENWDAKPTEIDADARAAAENALQNAERRLEAWRAWSKSQAAFKNVVEYHHHYKLLGSGPEGVRTGSKDQVRKRLEKINNTLARVQEITGWPTVKLSPSYEILINGRPLGMPLADSEKLRAQWSIQVVFAVLTNAKWIILDKCDTLRDESWDGLLKLADYWAEKNTAKGTYFVMCATSPPTLPVSGKVISTDM